MNLKIFAALLFLIAIRTEVKAQHHDDPVRGDIYIYLVVSDSNETAVKKMCQYLGDHDYLIDTTNTNPLLVLTRFNYSKIRGNHWGIKLEASIKGNTLKFKIIALSQTGSETEDVPQVLSYRTNSMTMNSDVWDGVIENLRRYPHKQLFFSKN